MNKGERRFLHNNSKPGQARTGEHLGKKAIIHSPTQRGLARKSRLPHQLHSDTTKPRRRNKNDKKSLRFVCPACMCV